MILCAYDQFQLNIVKCYHILLAWWVASQSSTGPTFRFEIEARLYKADFILFLWDLFFASAFWKAIISTKLQLLSLHAITLNFVKHLTKFFACRQVLSHFLFSFFLLHFYNAIFRIYVAYFSCLKHKRLLFVSPPSYFQAGKIIHFLVLIYFCF